MKIKFSHRHPKLYGQTSALLLHMILCNRSDLSEEFIEYDTVYTIEESTFPGIRTGHYQLPSGRLMVLVFLGNKLIPFTTVRRWTPEKEQYYRSGMGKQFDIEYATNDGGDK